MKQGLNRIGVLVAVALMLLLSACAGGATNSQSQGKTSEVQPVAPSGAQNNSGPASGAPQQAGDSSQSQTGSNTQLPNTNPNQQAVIDERMIIRTGSLALVVKNPDVTAADIQRIAQTLQGYMLNSQISNSGNYRIANISIKVPSENFFDAMSQIKGLAKGDHESVRSESTKADDVTEEYNDIDTQLKTLHTQYDTYIDLLKSAKTTDDALKIRTRIDDLQNQINRLEGRRNFLSKNAAFSTINITLTQVAAEVTITSSGWDPLLTLRNAWNSFLLFSQGVVDLLIYLVIFGWPFALLAYLIVWLVRRTNRNRPVATHTAGQAPMPPPPPPTQTAQ